MPNEKLSSIIEIDKAEFYVGDEEPNNGNLSPGENSSSPVRIILQTKDADELFEKALKLGATQICPMTTENDWRIGKTARSVWTYLGDWLHLVSDELNLTYPFK